MIQTPTQRKTSLLALALGSLIATSLSTGTAQAGSLRCAAQCRPITMSKSDTILNNCVKECPETVGKILEGLKSKTGTKDKRLTDKINTSGKHVLESLKAKQKLKDQEISFANGMLYESATKEKDKRNIQGKIKALQKESKELGGQIEAIEKALGAQSQPSLPSPVSTSASNPIAGNTESSPAASTGEATAPKAPFVSRLDPNSPRAPLPPVSKKNPQTATDTVKNNSPAPTSAPLPPPLVSKAGGKTPPPVPPLPPAPPLPPRNPS